MSNLNKGLGNSAFVMRLVGWGLFVAAPLSLAYTPGFLWGVLPEGFPHMGPPHPPSHYDGLHPYLFMMLVVYVAWAILMIRGARDPKANAALFDFGILANLLHGLLMIPQAFIYPNEHAHLWTDIPLLFIVCLILWIYHPNRVASGGDASQ